MKRLLLLLLVLLVLMGTAKEHEEQNVLGELNIISDYSLDVIGGHL